MPKAPTEIRSLACAHTAAAIKVLAGVMNQPKAPMAARVSAAVALLDRGWGKPTQMVAGDPEGAPIPTETVDLGDRELARRIALILSRADPKMRRNETE
ncbi:MAG: hypothetical protein IIA72_06550 [Proteobacteria bacterium]|nr:hypothetical protein [Pseudomonadota bacterium]